MGILGKLFGEKAPAWAQPITLEEFQEFKDDVTREVEAVGDENEFLWNEGKVIIGGSIHMHFHNLIANWKAKEKAGRRDLVRKYVAGMLQGEALRNQEVDFDRLALRVYDFEGMKTSPFMTTYPIGENLAVALVQDLPDSVATINKDWVEKTGKSPDELYQIARNNMKERVKHEFRKIETPFGDIIMIGAEVFGGAYIAMIDRIAKPMTRYLVASPTRDEFLFLEPKAWSREAAEAFLDICHAFVKSSPNNYIYPFVLEFRDGVYTDLCVMTDGKMIYKDDVKFDS